MGKPSAKRRSARRPGKSERARVKKHRRGSTFCYVRSAGTSMKFVYGRKKFRRVHAFLKRDETGLSILSVNR